MRLPWRRHLAPQPVSARNVGDGPPDSVLSLLPGHLTFRDPVLNALWDEAEIAADMNVRKPGFRDEFEDLAFAHIQEGAEPFDIAEPTHGRESQTCRGRYGPGTQASGPISMPAEPRLIPDEEKAGSTESLQ